MSLLIRYILLLFSLVILWECASPVSPTGGPRDEEPPILDSLAYSTPNQQTNFEKQTIELTFNEWVQLNDAASQVLVSPPLEFLPTVRLKRRTVLFEFDEKEQLRENATYTINFGEAVQDLTERNPAENLRFVFSTGPVIDSLIVAGRVIDALTNEPVEDVRVMLYDNLADTVVRTERPFYFAKTDEAGEFLIENVQEGAFKLFALEDANLNYRFDQVNERIAIVEAPISVGADSSESWLLRLFQSKIPIQISDVANKRFGLINLNFLGGKPEPDRLLFTPIGGPDTLIYEYELDSVKVWYPNASADPWSLIVQSGENLNDTIEMEALSKDEWLPSGRLVQRAKLRSDQAENLNPDRPTSIQFNHPLVNWDTSQISLLEDSVQTRVIPQLYLDTLSGRKLWLDYAWKEEIIYQLQILPGALTDIFGLSNRDTILQNYTVSPRKTFGILTIKFQDMLPDSAYLIEIIEGKEEVVDQLWVSGQTELEQSIPSLPTGNYSVRVTLDGNRNKKWDTGDYDAKRLPESVFLQELGNLRANWEVEETVSLKTEDFNVPIEKEPTGGTGRS